MPADNPRYYYFDRIRIWLKTRLADSELDAIKEKCGKLYVENKMAWFDWTYLQKIEIYQPTATGLDLLGRLNNVLLNYVEVACDVILADETSLDRLHRQFKDRFLQSRHGNRQVKSYEQHGYTTRQPPKPGERRNGTWFQ